MNVLLIFSVLILIAIAIWQVTKIFELSQGKKVYTQVADDDDNNWNGKLMFGFLFFIYGITIFSFVMYGDVLLPKAASEHGSEYDNLMWISFAIIFFYTNYIYPRIAYGIFFTGEDYCNNYLLLVISWEFHFFVNTMKFYLKFK